MKTEFTIKHTNYMMTIAEYIEGIEQITEAKVIKISESDGRLTFYLEYPEPVADDLIEDDNDGRLMEYFDHDAAENWVDPHEY